MNRLYKLLFLLGFALTAGHSMAADTPPQTLFTNINIFNGTDDRLYKNHSVLVENNLIKVISASAINTNANATVIDGQGRTLMPGLIDSHMHFNMNAANLNAIAGMRWDEIGARAAAQAADWLADGFTTVRGMGGTGNGLKKTIDAGLLDGPRIYPSGAYISQTSGHGDFVLGTENIDPSTSNVVRLGLTQIVDGADAVRAAVRRNFARGASQIKIMVAVVFLPKRGRCSRLSSPTWKLPPRSKKPRPAIPTSPCTSTRMHMSGVRWNWA